VTDFKFKPPAYSDVSQAQTFAYIARPFLRHCEPLGWLFYEDGVWKETPYPRQLVQNFCIGQLMEARRELEEARKADDEKTERGGAE